MSNATSTAAREVSTSRAFELSVRLGIVSYGVVHLLIAWLAVQLALGDRSGSPSQQGAINQLAQQPFGTVLLWTIALGFVALTVWKAIEAAAGHTGSDGKERALKRAASGGKAGIYAVLAFSSAQAALGEQSKSGTDHATAELMKLPLGQLIVGAVALVIIGVGVAHIAKGVMRTFEDRLDASATASGSLLVKIAQVGYVAKGISLGIIGALFGWAAITFDPDKSGGLDVALRTLLDAAYGPVLLIAIGLGIGCFGVYCFGWARSANPTA